MKEELDLKRMLQRVKTEQFSNITARLIIKAEDINNNNYKVFNGELFLRSDLTFRSAWDLWKEYRLKVLQASLEADIVFAKYRQVSLDAF